MAKKGKRYQEAAKLIDRKKMYSASEALDLVIKTATAKFDESVEVNLALGLDQRKADQNIRGTLVLPNGTGKSVKILVLAKDLAADKAKAAGADYVGAEEIISKIQTESWLDFDVCITTPDMMPKIGPISRILGPKGLMPNPKSGTVVKEADLEATIGSFKAGKVEYRLTKTSTVNLIIGKKSFGVEKLVQNYDAVLEAINNAKPSTAKGVYIKKISVASSMGPGVFVASK